MGDWHPYDLQWVVFVYSHSLAQLKYRIILLESPCKMFHSSSTFFEFRSQRCKNQMVCFSYTPYRFWICKVRNRTMVVELGVRSRGFATHCDVILTTTMIDIKGPLRIVFTVEARASVGDESLMWCDQWLLLWMCDTSFGWLCRASAHLRNYPFRTNNCIVAKLYHIAHSHSFTTVFATDKRYSWISVYAHIDWS